MAHASLNARRGSGFNSHSSVRRVHGFHNFNDEKGPRSGSPFRLITAPK